MKWHTGHIGEAQYRKECVFDQFHGLVVEAIDEDTARLVAATPDLLAACRAIANLNAGQGQLNMCEIAGMARQAINLAIGK